MFPVVPEPWPRSKAELETIDGKHFPRKLPRGFCCWTALDRIKKRTDLESGEPACGEAHVIEKGLSLSFSVVMEDLSLSPKLRKAVSSLCGTEKYNREPVIPRGPYKARWT